MAEYQINSRINTLSYSFSSLFLVSSGRPVYGTSGTNEKHSPKKNRTSRTAVPCAPCGVIGTVSTKHGYGCPVFHIRTQL